MLKNYPLSLSSYFLDFSYPGKLNLENRIFLNIPLYGNVLNKNKIFKFIEISFEMNSIFNKGDEYKFEGMDRGLVLRVDCKEINLPSKNIHSYFTNQINLENPQSQQSYFFESEKDLYENIFPVIKNFLSFDYNENWINFAKESREKYLKKFFDYASEEEKNEKKFLENQLIKINKFSTELIERADILFNSVDLDSFFIKKMNLSFIQNNEKEEIIELKKLLTTFQYHKLNKELLIKNSSKCKSRKV